MSDVWWQRLGGRAHLRSRPLCAALCALTATTLPRVAQPLRTPTEPEAPPVDPNAVQRAYRLERARRRVRDERRRASRRANRRFWVILLGLVIACVVIVLTAWHEVERLFGL